MIKHIVKWLGKTVLNFVISTPMKLIGLFAVPIALRFKTVDESTAMPFKTFPGTWKLVRLPKWAAPWDNCFDGAWGDKRGWWDNYCKEKYKKDCTSMFAMWFWLAVRNPTNYLGRIMLGVDLANAKIEKLAGDDLVDDDVGEGGWQFLLATTPKGKQYYRLNCVFPWFFNKQHAVMFNIGWKFDLSHNGITENSDPTDRFKGTVFRITPWKSL